MCWFVWRDDRGLQDEKLNQDKMEAGNEKGGGPSINYIYKEAR